MSIEKDMAKKLADMTNARAAAREATAKADALEAEWVAWWNNMYGDLKGAE